MVVYSMGCKHTHIDGKTHNDTDDFKTKRRRASMHILRYSTSNIPSNLSDSTTIFNNGCFNEVLGYEI